MLMDKNTFLKLYEIIIEQGTEVVPEFFELILPTGRTFATYTWEEIEFIACGLHGSPVKVKQLKIIYSGDNFDIIFGIYLDTEKCYKDLQDSFNSVFVEDGSDFEEMVKELLKEDLAILGIG